MERLKGRVAIVTGAGQGMGLAIAHACAQEGAKVVVADINDQTIGSAVEEIRKKNGAEVMGLKVDITKRSEVEKGVQQILGAWGRIDCLVNCAGGALNTPYKLEEIEEKHWDLVVNVNMKGTFLCCQQVIPTMVKQGKGAIVNISALAGHWRASLAGVQYSAAKAGVEGITRQLAYDFGPLGVRINCGRPHGGHDQRTDAGSLGRPERGGEAEGLFADSRSGGSAKLRRSPRPSCFCSPTRRATSRGSPWTSRGGRYLR